MAEKAVITSVDLCKAGKALAKGQGDNLGGGVWKKRLLSSASDIQHALDEGAMIEVMCG